MVLKQLNLEQVKTHTWRLDEPQPEDDLTALLAIHCPLQIFRLVYFINCELELNLVRMTADIDVVQSGSLSFYPVYHFFEPKSQHDFYVIANTSRPKSVKPAGAGSLFQTDNLYSAYLIPEKKNVDYFLKIRGCENCDKIAGILRKTPLITSVYTIDIMTLKSRENLIFN